MGAPAAASPLAGVRVLDLSRLAPGLFATTLLGDLGADIVSVEAPTDRVHDGELDRLPGYGGAAARQKGVSPLYRGRRSIVVDLKQPEGRDIVRELSAGSDVMVEGFRPGVCDRLGVGFEDVARMNPGIVYCSITGYGQHGTSSQRPGHDINYLAESGLLSVLGRDGKPPAIPLNAVADLAGGGLVAAFGILAALRQRDATGRGAHLDIAMADSVLALLGPAMGWIAAGSEDPAWGRGLLAGGAPFYDCYLTEDDRWLSVAALEHKFFVALCGVIGRDELVVTYDDPSRWPEVRAALTEAFRVEPCSFWLDRLQAADVPAAPARSISDAYASAHADGRLTEAGAVPIAGFVAAARREPNRVPGEHTEQILLELGRLPADVERLTASGIVGGQATSPRTRSATYQGAHLHD